jgi:long-chain acyl-CoA synthetase
VVPEWDALEKWAQIKKLDYTSRRALLDLPITHAKMEKEVRAKLAGLAPFETPKKIGILEHEFSIERGELTPKLSVKRKVVSERYKDVIDALYAEDGTRDAS